MADTGSLIADWLPFSFTSSRETSSGSSGSDVTADIIGVFSAGAGQAEAIQRAGSEIAKATKESGQSVSSGITGAVSGAITNVFTDLFSGRVIAIILGVLCIAGAIFLFGVSDLFGAVKKNPAILAGA